MKEKKLLKVNCTLFFNYKKPSFAKAKQDAFKFRV